MFLLRRPTSEMLAHFVERAKHLHLSYSPVGLARQAHPAGFRVAESQVVLGHGQAVFERAVQLVAEWRPFDLGWVGVYPPSASVATGTTVAVVAHHLGFWSVHACRIVYPLSMSTRTLPPPRGTETVPTPVPTPVVAGFAYGTLSDHAEIGEEIFAVSIDPGTGVVTYSIRAVSREGALLARLGAPVARAFQARFRRDSLAAMQRHMGGASRGWPAPPEGGLAARRPRR
jgi:uncharacterized protein (UPF0548 family)